MSRTLLQFDFPYSGPWGPAMAEAMAGLAQDIATEPGLVWKIWTESEAEGRAGGLYLFETADQAEAYRAKHAARLGAFGITGIRAIAFAVNDALSRIDRAPV
ncbi:monooxygenase [Ruixingdingia sedimenti]|uniref:Monooxygenase n=1 Tax=Ruixingdingia sedimenti TaxID=3073604 RepID=A0ABU1F2D9_9RHOB|nr:monooxygenase [Xinfangfangia sp. LG-4]MDR5651020.1 monooxygenase [Xinfangfangia sp. LG-4]